LGFSEKSHLPPSPHHLGVSSYRFQSREGLSRCDCSGRHQEGKVPFGYREGKGWPVTAAGGMDIAAPKAAAVKVSLPQVVTGFGSVPSEEGF